MAYQKDLKTSARRHLRSGQLLFNEAGPGDQPGAKAVAGYIFGLAGELAVKQVMRDSGMKELSSDHRRDDPFYAHFPMLKSLLAEHAHGRRDGELRKIAESSRLFQNWDTDMRYAPTSDIKDQWIVAWKASAEELINVMDLM